MRKRDLAVVTGASSGIGFELARCAAQDGCDVVLVADEHEIRTAAAALEDGGSDVTAIEADLGTEHGVAVLWQELADRHVDYFAANAGRGLGGAFLDQDWEEIEAVIHTNVTGSTALLHRATKKMRDQGEGRILITGAIAGEVPGAFRAVYNATTAYLDTLSWGIREELKDDGVTVTCLMPGPTDTEFFDRAQMDDTPVGQYHGKADPAKVARAGWDAMKRGSSGVTPGFMNKLQRQLTGVIPDTVLARVHRNLAEPRGAGNG